MFKNKIALSLVAAFAAAGSAMAAVPTEVSDALTTGKTDAITVAGLGLVIVIGVAVIKYMRRGV